MESAAPYQQLSEHPIRRLAHQAALVGFGALIGATSVSLILTQQASPVSTRVAVFNDEVPPDSLAVGANDHVGVKFVVCSMDHSLVALGDKWSNFTLFQNTMTQFYSPLQLPPNVWPRVLNWVSRLVRQRDESVDNCVSLGGVSANDFSRQGPQRFRPRPTRLVRGRSTWASSGRQASG